MNQHNASSSPNIIDIVLSSQAQTRFETEELSSVIPENDELIYSRSVRQLDLNSAASGYGHEVYCPEGIPVETALFATLAASGLAFGILFMAVTMITMPPMKRKKRGGAAPSAYVENNDSPISIVISDLIWEGM